MKNPELKENLRKLGWSEELIKAVSAVSKQVDEATVVDSGADFNQLLASSTTDRNDIRILNSGSNTSASFDFSLQYK